MARVHVRGTGQVRLNKDDGGMAENNIRIELVGMDEVKRALRAAGQERRQAVIAHVNKTAIDVQRDAKQNVTAQGAIDTGRLRSSIRVRLDAIGDGIAADVYTDVKYAPPVEFGAQFHGGQPPVSALAGWARRHGIPASALFVIARKIGTRGLPARPFMFPAWEKNKGPFVQGLREITNR